MAKVLFLAHDYPPAASPQALRAFAHVQALAKAGHQLLVVSRAERGMQPHAARPESDAVSVMRVSPGWPETLIWRLQSARNRHAGHDGVAEKSPPEEEEATSALRGLNWKGRLVALLRQASDVLMFPDRARVWAELAVRPVRGVMETFRPQLVFASHEPASSILLAIKVKPGDVPLVVDLGDPFVAEYTPGTWQKSRSRLENRVMELASAIIVTSKAFAGDLRARYPAAAGRVVQIQQGYGQFPPIESCEAATIDGGMLQLIYTGRFYPFRDPAPLLEAVHECENVALDLFLPDQAFELPGWVYEHDRIRVRFGASHAECLRNILRADILVNIANRNPLQIPGKFFEYLGSQKPILHLHPGEEDEQAQILARLSRGWACPARAGPLKELLSGLADSKREGALHDGLDLAAETAQEFSQEKLGERLVRVIEGLQR